MGEPDGSRQTLGVSEGPNLDLLEQLREIAHARPRDRLHVHPGSAMWLSMSISHHGLGQHVQIVPDPACTEPGRGFIEWVSHDRWDYLRSLVGTRVRVSDARLGELTGVLLTLDHREARVDVGDGDVRYLHWISIHAVKEGP